MAYCLYAACCSRQGGIAVLDGTEEGTLSLRQMATADRPMYMAMDGGKLLTLLLAPEGCGGDSALTAFPQEKDGRLRPHGELRSTGGVEACHLAARGGGYGAPIMAPAARRCWKGRRAAWPFSRDKALTGIGRRRRTSIKWRSPPTGNFSRRWIWAATACCWMRSCG